MQSMNTPYENSHVYRFQEVADKIETLITDGSILPGERLPAERKLAIRLQVSRSSVREALRILVQKGFIEIRRGVTGGAFVKTTSFKRHSESLESLLQFNRLSLDQIAEFRNQIESGVTILAAAKANSDDLRMLNSRLERVRSLLARGRAGIDQFIEADKAVHLCIANIAGNPLFAQALKATMGLKRYFFRFHDLAPSLMEKNFQDLSAIVRAVENRQPQAAARITREHISRFNELNA
ncbi:FadR/GntR family transcriptional regulator [uncultured Desulfosarcina sp.]|uniref:FadR/GntR family transcriptional regulator n=1 Tax=uncultured Desulfosarcina sp. TaxID=218289 RepID=UPI0029C73DA0|nr:FadR/GntR family transcriptional regulator [uncultured Desulfosarcina sp.]